MTSYQIWSYHVTQGKIFSLLYLKSCCPLNFRKSQQILWFYCIPKGIYKEDCLKAGRICPPPPLWNRVKSHCLRYRPLRSLPNCVRPLLSKIVYKVVFSYFTKLTHLFDVKDELSSFVSISYKTQNHSDLLCCFSCRDWSLLIPRTGAEGNIIFLPKN